MNTWKPCCFKNQRFWQVFQYRAIKRRPQYPPSSSSFLLPSSASCSWNCSNILSNLVKLVLCWMTRNKCNSVMMVVRYCSKNGQFCFSSPPWKQFAHQKGVIFHKTTSLMNLCWEFSYNGILCLAWLGKHCEGKICQTNFWKYKVPGRWH